jgi:hypothetical protein
MAYSNSYDLSVDATFLKQVLVAMMNQCATVLSEAATVAGHTPRANLAVAVINNPTAYQAKFAFAVITQGGITPTTVPSTVVDSAVQTAVAAVWNAMAGYFTN